MRDRTADLLRAKQALSQLSYSPIFLTVTGLQNFSLDKEKDLQSLLEANEQSFDAG